jgi:hypothetical protein
MINDISNTCNSAYTESKQNFQILFQKNSYILAKAFLLNSSVCVSVWAGGRGVNLRENRYRHISDDNQCMTKDKNAPIVSVMLPRYYLYIYHMAQDRGKQEVGEMGYTVKKDKELYSSRSNLVK